jgi:hypothetical protein
MAVGPDTHPSDAELHRLAHGELGDSAASAVIEHLESCAACRARAAELPDCTLDINRPASVTLKSFGPSRPEEPGRAADSEIRADLARTIGYEIVRELGRGGMGVVYLARNLLMDRLEVLKVMNKAQVGRAESIERFVQEIRSAARLNHPNVATAYSTHLLGEQLVLAMEYVEGEDLGKVVKTRGRLPIPFSAFCAREAALGLQRGHEIGLVHRDIKPSNLILTRQGKRSFVKIVDFGLAKARAETPTERGLTATNQIMGTVGFTAPEQLRDARSADTRADIYSLGCTLYCLLAGEMPFQGSSAYEVFLAQAAEGARPLREIRPEIPEELAAIVNKMMSKNPADRFSRPGEVAEALLPFMKAGATVGAGEVPPVPDGARDAITLGREPKPKRDVLDEAPETQVPARRPGGRSTNGRGPAPRETMAAKKRQPRRRSLSLPLTLFVAAVVCGCVAGGALLWLRDRPPVGVIVVEGVPADSVVDVEGYSGTPTRDGESVTATGVSPGQHLVRVLRGGQLLWSKSVSIEAGEEPARLKVELPPPPVVRAPEVNVRAKEPARVVTTPTTQADKPLQLSKPAAEARKPPLPPPFDPLRPPPPRPGEMEPPPPDPRRPPPPPFDPRRPPPPRPPGPGLPPPGG